MSDIIFGFILFLAKQFEIEPSIIIAIGEIESNWEKHKRYRFEPNFYQKYILGKKKYIDYAPSYIAASYGYMQIMITSAMMVGYDPKDSDINKDFVNLYYAVKYLKRCYDVFGGKHEDAISAYNAGTPQRKRIKNKIKYKNQKYVDKVILIKNKNKKEGIYIEKGQIHRLKRIPLLADL